MATTPKTRAIFITGTDTGVGKTLFTGLLLHHLRASDAKAFALKPFCSGGRDDAQLLHSLQNDQLTLDEINPFHFRAPLTPLIAARKNRRRIPLNAVLVHYRKIAQKICRECPKGANPTILIEGAGGLLAPLGEKYSALDIISQLSCRVIVVALNRLGTINHTLLTVRQLQQAKIADIAVVLMGCISADPSASSNIQPLKELLSPISVTTIPFLGSNASTQRNIRVNSMRFAELLNRLC